MSKILGLKNFIISNKLIGGASSSEGQAKSTQPAQLNNTAAAVVASFGGMRDSLMDYGLVLSSDNQSVQINHGTSFEETVNLDNSNLLRKILESYVVTYISNFNVQNNLNIDNSIPHYTQRFLNVDGTRIVVHNNQLHIRSNTVNLIDIHQYLDIAIKFFFANPQ